MSRGVGYDFKSPGGPTEITYLQNHTKCYYLSPIFFWERFFGRSNLHVEVIVQNLKLRGSFWDVEPFFGHILKKWNDTIQRTFCCLSCCWFGKLGELGFFIWNADMLITSKPQNGRWAFEKDQHDSSYHTKKIPYSHPHHFQHQIFTIQHPALSSPILSSTMVVFFAISASDSDGWERLFRWFRPVSTKENITWYYYPMIIPWLSIIIHYYPWFFPRLSLSGAMPVGISRGYEPGRILLQLPISQIGETVGPVGDWNQMLEPSNFGIFYMCVCIGIASAILAFFKRT